MVIGYRLYDKIASPRQMSEATKDLLIQLVKKYWAGTELQQVTVGKNPSGAPLLSVNGQPVYCSLSHKSGCLVAAYSTTGHIGIDVEDLQTRKSYQRIRDYYKDGFLSGCSSTTAAFLQRWTLAEAVAKASGLPLLKVLEEPPKTQQQSAKYFKINTFLLCAYQASPTNQANEISLHQLETDNQWQ